MSSVSPALASSPNGASSREARVLVSVRDAAVRESLLELIKHSAAVVTSTEPTTALEAIQAASVDLLIFDAKAAAVIAQLRREPGGQHPAVVIIGSEEESALHGQVEPWIDDFWMLPLRPAEVAVRLRTHGQLARNRREAAERVRESEQRFRHVADHSPLMFWVAEPDGRCCYRNQRWYEFTGRSREDSYGLGWLDALHVEDHERVKNEFLTANATQQCFRVEYRLRRHDGVFRWMLDSAAPRFFQDKFAGYVGSIVDITDERDERLKLARERSQMAMALRAGRIGTFDWDIPGGRVYWSPELESLYGLAPGAFQQSYRCWAQRVLPEDVATVERLVQRCFEQRLEELEYEFRIVLPDGTQRWLEGKARFVFGPNGAPRRMIGINIDVDDHKRNELSNAFISHLSQEIALLSEPQAILSKVSSDVGRHLHAHRCYFLTTDEAVTHAIVEGDWVRSGNGSSLAGRYPIANFGSLDLWRHVTARTMAIEDVHQNALTENSRKDYASLNMTSWASAPFMRDGRWVASLVVADDRPRRWRPDEIQLVETVVARIWPLVERARSEQAVLAAETKIRESEERLRVTVQAARLGTWDVNPKTGAMMWDARCKQLFGLPPDAEVTWERFIGGIHPDDRAAIQNAIERALRTESGGDYDIEARTVSPIDGAVRWVRGSGKAFFDVDGTPVRFTGTVLDITDIVKARETLAERRAELERLVAERTARLQDTVAELESFSYSISHDLRAPLRAMQSFAQILNEECRDQISDNGRDYLRRIVNASQRMDRLIHDVLVYSRVSRTELQLGPVNVEQLINGILESYPQFQTKAADIEVRRPLPGVLGNEAALTQCLSNLLGNAVKFVAASVRPKIQIWAEVHGARVRLFISDNGIGIAADAHEKIFGIFERLSRDYDGTGIGLAVVRKAAERMGGSVTVASTPGTGSTFCLELASSA